MHRATISLASQTPAQV